MSAQTNKAGFSMTIDTRELSEKLTWLSDPEERKRISYFANMAGAYTLKKYAQEGFRRKLGEAADHPSKDPRMKGRPFYEGVFIHGYRYDLIEVHVMGDYRMKWFETGTEDRYTGHRSHSDFRRGRHSNKNTGKGQFRGNIDYTKYGGWFREARNHKQEITDAVIRSIDNAMRKKMEGKL